MANRKLNLSGSGKNILDELCNRLNIDRPNGIKLAFAKGLAKTVGKIENSEFNDNGQKWTIPDGIIRDKEYLLFKHLIINELQSPLNDDEVNKNLLLFIEKGLRIIENEINELSSLEDYRLTIFN
jgi:hypothetical protein